MTAATPLASAEDGGAFNPRIIGALIVAGIIGFIGFWVLSAFAPELSSGRNGGNHALSRSATGFAGIARLLSVDGRQATILRTPGQRATGAEATRYGGLVVLTPDRTATAQDVVDRVAGLESDKVIILPKHMTVPTLGGGDRVMRIGLAGDAGALLRGFGGEVSTHTGAPAGRRVTVDIWGEGPITIPLPDTVQTLSGDGIRPLVSVDGRVLVGELEGRDDTYVIADPDIVNNLAMANDESAAAAVALIERLAARGEPVAFDVMMNGLGSDSRSLLRSAFVPPFLGLTLCLIALFLFLLWHGFVRFGPPVLAAAARVSGKAALVATGARLIVQARRVARFGPRYTDMVRDVAVRRLHAPASLSGHALDQWLDRFPDRRGRTFSGLAARLDTARTAIEAVEHAAALAQWRKDVLRDL